MLLCGWYRAAWLGEPAGVQAGSEAGAVVSASLEERLQEERAALLAQLELLEKKKNEEMQNLKTSLIAEQQVTGPPFPVCAKPPPFQTGSCHAPHPAHYCCADWPLPEPAGGTGDAVGGLVCSPIRVRRCRAVAEVPRNAPRSPRSRLPSPRPIAGSPASVRQLAHFFLC